MDINLFTWFCNRELIYCPPHFIKTNTPVTIEAKLWILEKCIGRYCYLQQINDDIWLNVDLNFPAFEDPKEAILYELTWS
jgi:hypothetical protein